MDGAPQGPRGLPGEPAGAVVTGRHVLGAESAGRRLDVVVAELEGVSRARAGELISGGRVRVAGSTERKSYRVCEGDVLEIEPAPIEVVSSEEPAEDVEVVFEDDHLLIVQKPAGLVVHPAPGVKGPTLVDALRRLGKPLADLPGPDRPGIVHRLDRDVSGVLVVAKTDESYRALAEAMKRRRVERRYLALVHGVPSADRGKIDAPVGRDPKHRTRMAVRPEGRPAVTWFAVARRFEGATLLDVRLETGRTHQIRTHLGSIGHPIVGDALYGRDRSLERTLGLGRPFLHAYRLAFDHPVTGERVDAGVELPSELASVVERLAV